MKIHCLNEEKINLNAKAANEKKERKREKSCKSGWVKRAKRVHCKQKKRDFI